MCRNAIDSAIFLAWQNILTEDLQSHELRKPPTNNSYWYWGQLRKQAIDLKLLGEDDIKFVEKVREKGHFSAHFAIKQDESRRDWLKGTSPEYEDWRKRAEGS